MKLFHF